MTRSAIQSRAWLPLALLAICAGLEAQPRRIILDTDMLTDPEDVNAVWLLNTLADRGEAEILACVVNGHEANRASGAAVDVVNTYFGRPGIPLGAFKGGYPVKRSPFTPLLRDRYPHRALDDDALPDALQIYRSVLAKQPDRSVTIVSIGFLVNLRDLLYSQPDASSPMGGFDLIRNKVKELVIMGGNYPRGLEYNFNYGGVKESTADVIDHWPDQVPMVFIGYELGAKVFSGRVYQEKLADGPLRLALANAYNALSHGRESWDELAVLYAVRGLAYGGTKYFESESVGFNSIDRSDGSNHWITSPDKNQSYLRNAMPADRLGEVLEQLVLAGSKRARQ